MAKKFDWNSLGLDFGNWEEEKIWALDLPVEEMDINNLLWHFDVPFWPNDMGDKWEVTPWDVINKKENTIREQNTLELADIKYPIDIFFNKNKYLILDGIHRLTKAYLLGYKTVSVRIIPKERLSEILIDEPIELPDSYN